MYQNIIRVLLSWHCILCIMPEVQSVKQLAAGMCALTHAFKCLTQFIRAFIQLITRVLCLQDEGVFKRDGHAPRWNPLRMDISCLCHIY